MATTAQLNAVFDAVRADAKQLVDDLVPAFFRSSAEAQITFDRVMKIVKDSVAAYEKVAPKPATPPSPSIAGPNIGSPVPPGSQA